MNTVFQMIKLSEKKRLTEYIYTLLLTWWVCESVKTHHSINMTTLQWLLVHALFICNM